MEFRQATQEDLDYVRSNPFEGPVKGYPYLEVPTEHCYAAIFEGHIVGVGGLAIHWEGVAEVWMILTADCKKKGLYGIVALYAIQNKMDELIEENNIWRAQATVRTDFPKAIEMIEFFGFQREGLLRKYFPDKCDGYRYARLS